MLTPVLMQIVFEFGPLWLIALSASAILFGPFWAALVATLGLGGLLAGRLPLHRPAVLAGAVAAMAGASLALVTSRSIAVITVAQVALLLLLAIVSIHVTELLHDAVPSTVRSGVASGVSAFTWLAFLPFAGVFGWLGETLGVYGAGWLIVAAVVAAGAVLVAVARRRRGPTERRCAGRPALVGAR